MLTHRIWVVIRNYHKPVNEMTVNGYRDVRCWQRHGAKLPGQRSPTTNHEVARALAREVHGKPWGKGVVNLVNFNKRNVVDALEPKWCAAGWWGYSHPTLSSFGQPGNSAFLKTSLNVDGWERGKPIMFRMVFTCGIQAERCGKGTVGKGSRRKQRPFCNETDRTELDCDRFVRPKGSRLPVGLVEREIAGAQEHEVTLDDG